ncbi:hypothetical protein Tco_0451367 [Tanacetum coccineum]
MKTNTPYPKDPICCIQDQETDNLGTTMEEYVQFENERALKNGKVYNWETAKYGMTNWYLEDVDINILIFFEPKFLAIIYNDALKLYKVTMEKVTSNEHEGKSKTFKNDFDWFNCDTPLKKGFDEFCKCWWGKEGMKDKLSDGSWSNYVPNDEWKLLEFERNSPIRAKQDCIGEYGLSIDDNDFKYMCDYLLSNDGPSFMKDTDERIEEKRCKLVRTPWERSANLEHEFDEWARTNCACRETTGDVFSLFLSRVSSQTGDTTYPTSMDTAY